MDSVNMGSIKQRSSKKATSPFLRPVVLFSNWRREYLRKELEDQQVKPQTSVTPNYTRSTLLSRRRFRTRPVIEDIVPEAQEGETDMPKIAPFSLEDFLPTVTLHDFLVEQRERVYTKFEHSIKKSVNEEWRKDIEVELEKLTLAEKLVEDEEVLLLQKLTQEKTKFNKAEQMCEKYAMLKMEVREEYERKTAQIWQLENEIASLREKLKEYEPYKGFLMAMAPAAWRERQAQKEVQRRDKMERLRCQEAELVTKEKKKKHVTKTKKCPLKPHKKIEKKETPEDHSRQPQKDEISDSDDEPEIFLMEPIEVMTFMDSLMGEGLFQIQNFKDTEDEMRKIQRVLLKITTEHETQMKSSNENIKKLKADIQTAQEIASDLELKSRLSLHGEYHEETMIQTLQEKVKRVYEKCTDEVEVNTSVMLTFIEQRVQVLVRMINELPPGMYEAMERTKESEREAKMLQEKRLAEKQRRRRAAERAAADIKQVTSRKLMMRSRPPQNEEKAPKNAHRCH